ncbi:MAG: type I methionyl aminopeptidase [Rhodospirillaceae bacterium]
MDARSPAAVELHGPEALAAMRVAGRFTAEVLDAVTPLVQPGVTTAALDAFVAEYVTSRGHRNAPLGYHGYPKSICTSVNQVVCHGIPGPQVLRDGDIINIDVSPVVDDCYGDSSRMFIVGTASVKARRLIDVTYDCMMKGIEVVRPGATLGDIGHAIQRLAEAKRYSVVRDFCGHGIGRTFHALPDVMHTGRPHTGMKLEEGMIFTIEPMINAGSPYTAVLDDGWTAVTRDKALSAQFEHTVAVTADGFEILTLSPKGWHRPPYGA